MDKHDAAELIRKLGDQIDDCKDSTARMMQGPETVSGDTLQWRRGYQAGLREAIQITQNSVSNPEKHTVTEALKIGGCFYYVGQIRMLTTLYPLKTSGMYIDLPQPLDQPSDPVVPFWGEWLEADRFTGVWYGPISPPISRHVAAGGCGFDGMGRCARKLTKILMEN